MDYVSSSSDSSSSSSSESSSSSSSSSSSESSSESSSSSSSSSSALDLLPAAEPQELNDELLALFECPVCYEVAVPPIMQCKIGHTVCSNCHRELRKKRTNYRSQFSRCPICRGRLGNIRNLAMEKVANNLTFPCKNRTTGCHLTLRVNNKLEHETECEFRPHPCPYRRATCPWKGQFNKIVLHLQEDHALSTVCGPNIRLCAKCINLQRYCNWITLQNCFGHYFMLVLQREEPFEGDIRYFFIVQLIGSRQQAKHFVYRLKVKSRQHRLTWGGTPRSSEKRVESGPDCLSFDNATAQALVKHSVIKVNVSIKHHH